MISAWSHEKLQTPSAKPFKILKWVGPNAYVIDRPLDMGISPIFNVEDLIPFQGPAVQCSLITLMTLTLIALSQIIMSLAKLITLGLLQPNSLN